MWNPFSRSHDEVDHEDDQDEDLVDAIALRIIAKWVADHDGIQPNGAMVDRSFVVGSAPR